MVLRISSVNATCPFSPSPFFAVDVCASFDDDEARTGLSYFNNDGSNCVVSAVIKKNC